MFKFLKQLAFIAITALTVVSCQKDELGAEKAINAEAQQRPELTGEYNITSVAQLPEGATLTARSAATNVTAYDVQGTYMGLLHDVYMNGNKKSDVQNLPVNIYANGSNKFRFEIPPFQVGSMPGQLSVNINELTLNSDGTFEADEANNYDELFETVTLNLGWSWNYNATFMGGSFTPVAGGHLLKFRLKCDKSFWNFSIFKADVSYDGTNNN